jgi:hypothetical protein
VMIRMDVASVRRAISAFVFDDGAQVREPALELSCLVAREHRTSSPSTSRSGAACQPARDVSEPSQSLRVPGSRLWEFRRHVLASVFARKVGENASVLRRPHVGVVDERLEFRFQEQGMRQVVSTGLMFVGLAGGLPAQSPRMKEVKIELLDGSWAGELQADGQTIRIAPTTTLAINDRRPQRSCWCPNDCPGLNESPDATCRSVTNRLPILNPAPGRESGVFWN